MKYVFLKKPKGIGGKILSPDDFYVEEALDKKFFSKFERTGSGMEKITGPYSLYTLKKKNMTTDRAIDMIARKLKINKKDIGYAGLKDKFAVTKQFVTMKNAGENDFSIDNIEMKFICKTNRHISVGDLIENKFIITLSNCSNMGLIGKHLERIKKSGLPNYFGPQRFGIHNNNQEIGRLIIKRRFVDAIDLINKIYGKDFPSLKQVEKSRLKFFLHSYQSWIFNETLKKLVKKNLASGEAAIFGSGTKLSSGEIDKITKNIVINENITEKDFSIRELGLSCAGGRRSVIVKPKDLNYEISGKKLKISFSLPKGSYATILLSYIQ
ncbi:tRNA pseudouridine(13) synthase TruD [archaeon]|nr:tRNA pseudouridine(13) synthase TruD [archaeon]